ncbi:hypothetical protein PHMEG_0003695 [Phytophthora megakarya]|uniref:DDE Tnp4 domain-containing protein n=1 Tax=Phytophthora megakarya TaxID=4795 RepID=A0A225WVI8_9STRA|nr:hypothetical protein PHMEG_0003695 [Phytophthora megakarya]
MASTAAQVLNRLTTQWDEETANLSSSHENFGDAARHVEDESSDSEPPTLAQVVASGGDDTLKGMTNFSSHFDTWHKHAIDFNMGVSTLEKMVHRAIQTIELVLYSQLVERVKMNKQIQKGNAFSNYPHALYATDVKFQPAYRPMGRFTERKVYFSAKHKLYGFKIECSVAPPGVAVDVSDHAPGSRSDLTMMLDRLSIHRQMLMKEDDSVPGGEPSFDSVARLCTALTNYHVGLMPLRARDTEHYDMVLSKYQAMGERIRTQRARAQRHYRMRQQVRSRPAPYNARVPASHFFVIVRFIVLLSPFQEMNSNHHSSLAITSRLVPLPSFSSLHSLCVSGFLGRPYLLPPCNVACYPRINAHVDGMRVSACFPFHHRTSPPVHRVVSKPIRHFVVRPVVVRPTCHPADVC